jgi:predicted phage terminase large subunit-like protein
LTLWEFFSEAFVPLQGIQLPLKALHKAICDALQDAFLGLLPAGVWFVIINMPPRTGKTKIAEACAAWGEAYFPDAQFIFTSYSGDLAEQSLAYVAQVMQGPNWYTQEIAGDLVHVKRADKVSTTQGGQLFAEGTGGSLTGKGAGLKREAGGMLFVDDAAKPDQALSPVESEGLKKWFQTTLLSRRNSDRWCPIVIIQQRLGPDDLVGFVQATWPENCRTLKFPALVGGESVIPETVSTEFLTALQRTRYGKFVFASQYQQEPIALGGNLIPVDSFGRYDLATARATDWDEIVIFVDTAMKTKEANDFSAAEAWGKRDGRIYLLDLAHGKWESPELLATVVRFNSKLRADHPNAPLRCIVEEKAAGIGLVQQMQKLHVPVEGIERDIDKVRRAKTAMPYIESGLVFIPRSGDAPWVDKFVLECAQFKEDGTHAHDDMCDPLFDACQHLIGEGLSILDVLGGKR